MSDEHKFSRRTCERLRDQINVRRAHVADLTAEIMDVRTRNRIAIEKLFKEMWALEEELRRIEKDLES